MKQNLHLFICLFLIGCAFPGNWFGQRDTASIGQKLEKADLQMLELLTFSEKAVSWRLAARKQFYEIMKESEKNLGAISPRSLLNMHKGATNYVRKIRQPILNMIKRKPFFMDFENQFIIDTDAPSRFQEAYWAWNNDAYHVNPADLQGKLYLRQLKIGLAASLTLLDNYALALDLFFSHPTLRRSLLQDIPDAYSDVRQTMNDIFVNYNRKYKNSKKLVRAINLFKKAHRIQSSYGSRHDSPYEKELDRLIQSSLSYQGVRETGSVQNLLRTFMSRIVNDVHRLQDFTSNGINSTTHVLSMAFGNGAGVFQSRSGKLKSMPPQELSKLRSEFRVLDIVLEKTPFRLTDKFIPGHYGHVAVWVGTKKELQELGVWDELPSLYYQAKKHYDYEGPSFQESVESGHMMLEALRPGIQLNTLKHFLDIDDLAVLRPHFCEENKNQGKCFTAAQRKEYLIEAFKQIGKDYDFNFDVNTEDKIVCSELAYRTYLDIDWETGETLGKHNISPDQVAIEADEEGEHFYPKILYFNGRRVNGDSLLLQDVFRMLLKKDYKAVEYETGICHSYDGCH